MNERVMILRDAVVKITQMLSGKGIKVTQRGVNAYVKSDSVGRPVLVNLPYLPDNATEELCVAIQGFLDHEVAHILFSDFSLIEKAQRKGCKSMLNILEDARIERCMAERFSGCAHNLSETGKFFLDKYTTPAMKEAAAKGDANAVLGILMVPLIRAMSGQHVFKDFMADKMHIVKPITDKIADLESRIASVGSTAECLDLADEIQKRLTQKPPEQPSGDKDGEGEESADSKTKDAKGKSKKKPEPKKDDKGEPKSEEKEEGEKEEGESEEKDESEKGGKSEPKDAEEDADDADAGSDEGDKDDSSPEKDDGHAESEPGEGSDADGKDGAASEGDAEPDEGEPDDAEPDEGEGDAPADAGEEGAEDDEVSTANTQAIWEAIDKENANDYDDKMSRSISMDATTAAKSADYLIYTKDGDLVEPLPVGSGYRPSMFKDMADEVDHMVGPLQKDLERAIAARSRVSWENGRRSGRLHAANLSRLAVNDERVFRRRHESTSKDVAVSLVVDASGSMSGAKIHTATKAAYALSSVLERLNIKHEVICFTTGEPPADLGVIEAEARKIGRNFSRVESLYMPILKGFTERLTTDVKSRFGWLPNSRILRNNVDGECLEVVARRLMQRREAGRVMIVLSDGAPNAYGDNHALDRHLKGSVQAITKAGVKTVGIGINSDAVRRYYPKHLVLNNVNELPDRVIKELRHLLVG